MNKHFLTRLMALIAVMIVVLLLESASRAAPPGQLSTPTPPAGSGLKALVQGRIIPSDSPRHSEPMPFDEYPARTTEVLALTGSIAFETDRAGTYDVYVQDADGNSAAVPLVTSSGSDFTPVWSPDGTQIVFASDRDGDFDIYLRTANGSEYNLTHNTADDGHPSWSPAGDRIIFTSNRSGSYFQIYTMRTDGTDVRQVGVVSGNNAMYPRYSPDGSRIAFMRASITDPICEWNWDVWLMNADGSNQRRATTLLGADLYPNWTLDGTGIVYASCRNFSDFNLYVVNPDTGAEGQITNWAYSNEWGAAYSPDGEYTIFNADYEGNTEIYIGPTAGGTVFNLTQNNAEDLAASWRSQGGATPTPSSTPTPSPTSTPGPTEPPPTPELEKPFVYDVRSCFVGSFYIQGPPLPNRYDAFVDWHDKTPAYVNFILNGTPSHEMASDNPTSHVYNMGRDLYYSTSGTRNDLHIVAVNGEDSVSPPYTLSPVGIVPPTWLVGQPIVPDPGCVEGKAKFQWQLSFPEPPFEGQATPPSWFPYIGGEPFGLKKTQASLDLEAASDGTGLARLSGETGFNVAGQEIVGQVYGKGKVAIQEDEGIYVTNAALGLEVSGLIKNEAGVTDVIPTLKAAEDTPIVGSVITWFNQRARLEAKLKPKVSAEASFHSASGGWRWGSINGGAKVKISLSLILKVIQNFLSVTAYGGGEPGVTFQVPPDPSYLKEVVAELFAGVKLRIWRFEEEFEAAYEWSYSPGSSSSPLVTKPVNLQIPTTSGWHPLTRYYTTVSNTYAIFSSNDESPPFFTTDIGLQAIEEDIIVANVFPESHPSLAVNEDTLLLWVHDDVNKPLMQGEEIRYSVHDDSGWSIPLNITDDNLQDFAPQVAFDGFGHAIAVWERNKNVQSSDAQLNSDYANAFEIIFALWDGSSWTIPTYLTNNAALDHAPVLVQGNDGQLLLVWRHNPTGELMGTNINTDTFYYTVWNGADWSMPQVLLADVANVAGLSAARHNGSQMTVVYSQDTDNDLTTSTDRELYALSWNGFAWSDPIRLTNDAESDDSPKAFYNAFGNIRLLWLKSDILYALFNNLTGTPQAVAMEGSATILDYAAAIDNAGNLGILWQGYSDEGVDIFYTSYDATSEIFSSVEQLTHDESLEKFAAPVFASTGEMLMTYCKDELITTTVTISPTWAISNVTTFGQSDLYVLRHTFGPDLVLGAGDVTLSDPNPLPGSSVQVRAVVHNEGDRAVVDPKVNFYQGDPSAGGMLIESQTVSVTLTGGMTVTVSVNWTVPGIGGPFTLYAVADPDEVVGEWNEDNNKAYSIAVMPDLVMADTWVKYGMGQEITLTVRISNVGVIAAPPVIVAFRLDDPLTGTVVAQAAVESVDAGAQAEVKAVWDASSTVTGWHMIYAIVDPSEAVVEANETNNEEWVGVGVLPDLVLKASAIVIGTNIDGGTAVSVWVFNNGMRDANSVIFGIYDRVPIFGTVPLTFAVVSVPAGEHRVVNLDLGAYIYGFYAGVNVDHQVEDRDVSNNVVRIGQVPSRTFLPLVFYNE